MAQHKKIVNNNFNPNYKDSVYGFCPLYFRWNFLLMSNLKTDKEELRKLFPVTKKYTYLDHSGVAPVSLKASDAAADFMESAVGEGKFAYERWMEQVEGVRTDFSDLICSEPEEIGFVRNTSHGISLVAGGVSWNRGDNVIIYEKEFPSNIYPWLNLESRGVDVRFLKSDSGIIRISDIEKLVDSSTRLISISSVQFASGYMIDLRSLGKFCRDNGIYFFVDAIQSLGIIPIDVKRFNIDFLAADGHKWLLSPEGAGIFYSRNEVTPDITPSLIGWKTIVDEFEYEKIDFTMKPNALKFEEGSLNIMGIFALGASLKLLMDLGIENVRDEIQELGDLIITNAEKRGFNVITPKDKKIRGGLVTFRGNFDPFEIQQELQTRKIIVSTRGGGIRVSPHVYNTAEEINLLFSEIDKILEDQKLE